MYLLYISYLTSFTLHIIWTRIRKVPFQHPWATFLPSTQENIGLMAVWAKWARYSIPHNFLNICDRKSIFVSLPMFSGSRKPVLTFILQLKIFFFFKVAAMQLSCRGPIGPQHIFDYTDVIRAWNWRTLSEMKSQ